MVGVSPNPNVVALKFAFVAIFATCFHPLLSGNQTPASIAVEVFDFANMAYTFRNGKTQTSGRTFTAFEVAVALLNLMISSSGYFGPLLKPTARFSMIISDC